MPKPPEEIFERLVEGQLTCQGISVGKMFGSPMLKVAGKVFAMLVKGRLVVKLPRERVERLQAEGVGELFDPGHGKPSKEWVAIDPSASRRWRSGLHPLLEREAGGNAFMKARRSSRSRVR